MSLVWQSVPPYTPVLHNFSSPKAVLLACKAALCYDNIVFV